MATIGGSVLTLSDWAQRTDPDGKTATIVELLNQRNEILTDMAWLEGNLPTGHRITQRVGLPTTSFRLINQGTTPGKSETAQVDEQCGILDAWSEVDKAIADLNGNLNEFRLSEAKPFIESMNQNFVYTLFYGDVRTNPAGFHGLTPRYHQIPTAGTANGDYRDNVLDGGGSGSDNTSVWLISWGEESITGIFPKGSKSGLTHEDLGLVTVPTSTSAAGFTGGRLRAYQDHFEWKCGIAVKDWRYIARICNIDVSALVANSGAANLLWLMSRALSRLPSNEGRRCFYMNRTVHSMLMVQAMEQSKAALSISEATGQVELKFLGVPIRKTDMIGIAETAVTTSS